jgi:sec-independent protein translocase protein TatA
MTDGHVIGEDNRGSSLEAAIWAARAIETGDAKAVLVGDVPAGNQPQRSGSRAGPVHQTRTSAQRRKMFPNVGPLEIGIVLVVALVVFGPKRLPELGHGIGRGLREFKHGITGDQRGLVDESSPITERSGAADEG